MLEVDIRELLDPQRVGMDQRKEEMGIFTSKGYVFENALSSSSNHGSGRLRYEIR